MQKLLVALVLLVASTASPAQVNTDQQGSWYGFYYNWNWDDSRWGMKGDWQYRLWDTDGNDLQTTLIRNGLTYRVDDRLSFTGGYVHLTRGAPGPNDNKTIEHRAYQEVAYWQKTGRFRVQHRVRTEQRWRSAAGFTTRYRYNLLLQYDLNDRWYLTGYNEYFVGEDFEFDQNRTKGAVGFRLTDSTNIHAGYMHQIDRPWEKGQFMLSVYHNF